MNIDYKMAHVESLFSKLDELNSLWDKTYKEILKIQKECDHQIDENSSAIQYSASDGLSDHYQCCICKKTFKGNPHK